MPYYYMKCIHCLRKLKNEDIYFETNESVVAIEALYNNGYQGTVNEIFKSNSSAMAEDAMQIESVVNEGSTNVPVSGGDTGKFKLSDFSGHFSVYTPVYSSPGINENMKRDIVTDKEGVLVNIHYIDSNNVERITTARHCPYCGSPLPPQSGMIPTYATLFLGGSSSGKTVYIATVNYLFSSAIKLPGNGYLQAIPAGNSNDEFQDITDKIFSNGKLPAMTATGLPEPLTLQVSYMKDGQIRNKCLMCFVDMRGEDMLTNGRLISRTNLIKAADSVLMAVDPLSIQNIAFYIAGDVTVEERGSGTDDGMVNAKMLKQINEEILPSMPGSIINVPNVVMMTKMDKIINNVDNLQFVTRTHRTINSNIRSTYDREYLTSMGTSAAKLFESADAHLYDAIRVCFKDPYFTTVSALGCSVQIGSENGEVRILNGSQFINPIRVMDPVIVLLTKCGFLPLFELDPAQRGVGQVIIN